MTIASVTIGLFVCLAVGVSMAGGALVNGRCPNVKGQENFDVNQYMGKWYIKECFANPFHIYHNCLSLVYQLIGDGKMRLHFTDHKVKSEKALSVDSSNPSKFQYHLSEDDPQVVSFTEIVVFTDYKTYCVEFSCIDLVGDLSIQYAWIATREKEIDPGIMKDLKARIQSVGIDINNFHTVDQSNCEAP